MRYWPRHLNKLRWVSLSLVFLLLVLLPFLHLYQTYVAAHAYDLLSPGEKTIYDSMAYITEPFVDDPAEQLDNIKGTTWSLNIFGLKISDPLAVVGQSAAGLSIYWPFVLTGLIPVALTLLLGRFYCGWVCPATFLYELNDNLGSWLKRMGLPISHRRLDRRLKYVILVSIAIVCGLTGSVLFAAIYPPAILGREIYYGIAAGGFGVGMVVFIMTLFFDLLVARRGFCRYLCPGGALYSLLGRFRPVRLQRKVELCNDCAKCNAICQFGLDPLRDDFTQECTNCTACIAVCPTDALRYEWKFQDAPYKGPGHLGHNYHQETNEQGAA
jgi:ferredoxin-type protein NapH